MLLFINKLKVAMDFENKFLLGRIEIDVKRCQIKRCGQIVSIEPRSMSVLVYLAHHHGEVISQQQLSVLPEQKTSVLSQEHGSLLWHEQTSDRPVWLCQKSHLFTYHNVEIPGVPSAPISQC